MLDNFEQLVDAAALLSEMLSASQQLVVTTREALKLSKEWVVPVSGMRFSGTPTLSRLRPQTQFSYSSSGATREARQLLPDADWESIVRLCRLTFGMPLAVELAASWVNVISCEEIVAEIKRRLGFPREQSPQCAGAARSVRAVFDQSWRLLGEPSAMSSLGWLSSGERSAARPPEQSPAASLQLLSMLVDSSCSSRCPRAGTGCTNYCGSTLSRSCP